jgi:ribosomal protein S12 methylthiotransferase
VNTCGFLQSAVREAHDCLRNCLRLKQRNPGLRVIAAGCLVQRPGSDLTRVFPELDAAVGIDDLARLPAVLAGRAALAARPGLPRGLCSSAVPRLVSTPRHYAYLRVADGCDNRCSYCLIPAIRGRPRSRSIVDVVTEARLLAANGVRELILIAQDTTAYAIDRCGRSDLARLLRRLSVIPGLEWLRLMYTHPAHYSPELLTELEANPGVVRYVDLPLQHVSDRILKLMNRPYARAEVEALLLRLAAIPGMAVRTTFITGFPGETEREFRELLDFVRAARFARAGCFAYSPEPRTRAARLPGMLPDRIREQRARELMKVQRGVSLARNRLLIGRKLRVLIDATGPGPDEYTARSEWDAPEIDNTVRVRGRGLRVGDFVSVRVESARAYDLVADCRSDDP